MRRRHQLADIGVLVRISGVFAREVERSLSNSAAARTPLPECDWWDTNLDFEDALAAAATGRPVVLTPTRISLEAAPGRIISCAAAAVSSAIVARYSCPWNIVRLSENAFAEEALRYLMVADRARSGVNADPERLRWVLLNLLAIRSQILPDLRFLDALNYFFEQLSRPWAVSDLNARLAAAFLGNYAAALESAL